MRKRIGLALALSLTACGASGESETNCDAPGTACTWAGVTGTRGFNGDGVDRRASWLYFVEDLTFAPDGRAWLLDWNNHRVRRVEADNTMTTMIGTDYEGDGPPGEIDRLPLGDPQGAPGDTIALNHPTDIEFMPDGTAILAAWHNNKLRVLEPSGRLTVLAGNSYGFAGDNQPAHTAVFNQPKAVAIDEEGTIFTVDQRNERIRMISAVEPRMIHTIAGMGMKGDSGDGGPAMNAMFGFDAGVTPRPSGSLALRGRQLFVADSINNKVRVIDLDTGTIECVAGGAGCVIAASFNFPVDIEFGPDGRLYVADRYNAVIVALDLDAKTTERVVGNGNICDDGSTNCAEARDGLSALEVQLNQPYGLAFDAAGNMYIADTHNSRVVRVAR